MVSQIHLQYLKLESKSQSVKHRACTPGMRKAIQNVTFPNGRQ